jgi:hypothetical protein
VEKKMKKQSQLLFFTITLFFMHGAFGAGEKGALPCEKSPNCKPLFLLKTPIQGNPGGVDPDKVKAITAPDFSYANGIVVLSEQDKAKIASLGAQLKSQPTAKIAFQTTAKNNKDKKRQMDVCKAIQNDLSAAGANQKQFVCSNGK